MITVLDVRNARERIANIVKTTPILTSEQLSELSGNRVILKSEHLQKTGSFKIRGAANRVIQAAKEGARHVTAASSGNHGQAVAHVAARLGIPATIVVPEDASLCKINAIKQYGGEIEKCGTTSKERLPRAKQLAEEMGGVFVPPYDDPYIMAGQGTIGLEILEQIGDVDAVIVPVGGGGLISGVLTAIKETKPSVRVIGVEPKLANDTYLSLQKNRITPVDASATIADGLRTTQPGDITFPVLQKYLDGLVLVSEEEIRSAFCFVLERMKQMIEPSSATTIAALMFHKTSMKNKKVAAVISGGNVDLAALPKLVGEGGFE